MYVNFSFVVMNIQWAKSVPAMKKLSSHIHMRLKRM